MDNVTLEWAGKLRDFRLGFGQVLDLEEACGGVGIGAIYVRMSNWSYRAGDVYHIIRLGLVGGGMKPAEAETLMRAHFDHKPLAMHHDVASSIVVALMSGVEQTDDAHVSDAGDPAEPMKFSEVGQICTLLNISPAELRACSFADVQNLLRGYAEKNRTAPPHLTEDEFNDILDRYEPKD